MELRHLRYFVAAAQAGNLHQAALKLHIVQPALSRQIFALEEELETPLFERTSHGVQLMPAGEIFLEGAVRILDDVNQLAARARRAAIGQLGTLSIGFNDVGIRSPAVPASFYAFRKAFPDAHLKLTLAKSPAQVAALEDGTLDAGFMFDRPPHLPQFDALDVFHDNRALVMPANHRLAGAAAIQLSDLRDEGFILTRQDQLGAGWDRVMAACRGGGLELRVVQQMDNEQAIISLVAAGMGLSFLTESARVILPADLVMRRVEGFSVPMTLELVWLRSNTTPLVSNFIDMVRATLRGLAGAPALTAAR